MHTPSYFLAAIRHGGNRGTLEGDSAFKTRSPHDILTSVSCPDLDCCWLTSPATTIVPQGSAGNLLLVLHGELHAGPGPTSAAGCLEAYQKRGMGFVADLIGSFALAVIDGKRGKVFLATDPVNSRKLLFGQHGGLAWVSTMHSSHLHPCSGKPDPTGLAHCLVNGFPLGGLTPFEGVRVLDRASIHEIRRSGVKSEVYWHFRPQPPEGATAKSLQGVLSKALLTAVERRLPATGEVRLSLSGGYDSTAVLGALRMIGVPDVSCYTYKRSAEGNRSDALVARQMAKIAGYECTELEADRDDVATVIEENVRWGHGLTRLVVETDTWRNLRGLLSGSASATFWVADHCFGMSPPRTLLGDADTLNSLAIADFSSLGPLKGLFPRSVRSILEDALHDDIKSILERNRTIRDPYLLRDYLYLDQRLPRLLSWREAFAEPCGEVRNPWTDREILELRQAFPVHCTLGKRLFKDTVRGMFPDLFAIDRAVAGSWHAGQWCREAVATQPAVLVGKIRSHSSPLDSYLPPEGLLKVIEDGATRAGMWSRQIRRARRAKGRVLTRIRGVALRNPPPPRPQPLTVDPAVFIMRAIVLRELFRQRSDASLN